MNGGDKAARLAAQLRDNLHKRKAQARALEGGPPAGEGAEKSADAVDKPD